jgi:glycosyltransferase involved in cell wall biosynthesis
LSNMRSFNRGRFNVAVVTGGMVGEVGKMFVENFLALLGPCCHQIFLLVQGDTLSRIGPNIQIFKVGELSETDRAKSIWKAAWGELLFQIRVSLALMKKRRKFEIVLFHRTKPYHMPLYLWAKWLRKKIAIFDYGYSSKAASKFYTEAEYLPIRVRSVFRYLLWLLGRLTYRITDQLVIESEHIVEWSSLKRYKDKISINAGLYLDISTLPKNNEVEDRPNLVGYIGRLTPTKGTKNFVLAIPKLSELNHDLEFLVGGDGPLFSEVKQELNKNNLPSKVKVVGGIPHHQIASYLNELKLLVVPSYSEGLPRVVQEAMACGTPVLATPVGAVPDLIKDGETGFIMEDNSPECIVRNVIRALEHPGLDEIAQNARRLIKQEYSYEAMVVKCQASLEELMKGKK